MAHQQIEKIEHQQIELQISLTVACSSRWPMVLEPVFKNSCGAKKFGGGQSRRFSLNSVKFTKIRPNYIWRVKETVIFWKNEIQLHLPIIRPHSLIIRSFLKNYFGIKKIWVNLKFNKLNNVIFKKYLHRSAQNSFLVFLYIFYFLNILNIWTVKSLILKFVEDRIHGMSVNVNNFF
jgi:hypothetical protein